MTTLYKVLNAENQSTHGGPLSWSVPTVNEDGTWTPGDWHEAVGKVEACYNGIHLTEQPMHWPRGGMRVYEAEGAGESDINDDPRHKIAFQRARLLRPADDVIPAYWRNVEAFIAELPTIPWMHPDGNPDPAWQLFPTRSAALGAARGDAYGAARGDASDAARGDASDAASDAALWARVLVCDRLPLAQQHIDHAAARMDVWRKGYGLYGDVNGVLYVYERVAE